MDRNKLAWLGPIPTHREEKNSDFCLVTVLHTVSTVNTATELKLEEPQKKSRKGTRGNREAGKAELTQKLRENMATWQKISAILWIFIKK